MPWVADLHADGTLTLVSPPEPRPTRPRCLHCLRGADGLDGDACCPGCVERGHAGPWDQCAACRQERVLLLGPRVEFTGP